MAGLFGCLLPGRLAAGYVLQAVAGLLALLWLTGWKHKVIALPFGGAICNWRKHLWFLWEKWDLHYCSKSRNNKEAASTEQLPPVCCIQAGFSFKVQHFQKLDCKSLHQLPSGMSWLYSRWQRGQSLLEVQPTKALFSPSCISFSTRGFDGLQEREAVVHEK